MYTCTYSGLIATKDTSEPAHFGVILLLHRGYPPSEIKLCCHDPVGTTGIALYISNGDGIRGQMRSNELCPLFEVSLYYLRQGIVR